MTGRLRVLACSVGCGRLLALCAVEEEAGPVRIQTQILRRINKRPPMSTPGASSNRFASRAEYEATKASDPFVELEVQTSADHLFDGCFGSNAAV